jgi:hypothetical protein
MRVQQRRDIGWALVGNHRPWSDPQIFADDPVPVAFRELLVWPPVIAFDAPFPVNRMRPTDEHRVPFDMPVRYPLRVPAADARIVMVAADESVPWQHRVMGRVGEVLHVTGSI